ncbi:hypothetical protein [Aerococcus christensenii]|uniref:hypothetical protein n=1 Tax=Aerococcus christensenii TaxID=87541 RepID=UPI0023A9E738|nr:hypothetical protein [Aerococcus christensenii]WEB71693.1 hypothetical protein PUW42_03885 [Aerococcus christensenii]
MKKIIGGKRYDTDTATEIATLTSGYPVNDFNYWEETLYLKKTGEFFIYGCGGPASRYSVENGLNSWSGGEAIKPISVEEAKAWGEEAMDADEWENVFGKIDEDTTNVAFSLLIPEDVYNALKATAEKENRSMKEIVVSCLKEKL